MVEFTSSEAGRRLGVGTREVNRLLGRGALRGHRVGGAHGQWLIDARSVSEYRRIRSDGRAWSAKTSWLLLEALSGRVIETDPSTASRLRSRIRESSADEIVRKTAQRVRTLRWSSDDIDRVRADLVLTGSSAVAALEVDLTGPSRTVEGYVADGDIERFAREHLLLPDDGGDVVLFDAGRPIGPDLPQAVVAADLARSTDTRAGSAGLEALEALRMRWIESNT